MARENKECLDHMKGCWLLKKGPVLLHVKKFNCKLNKKVNKLVN
jgi:hypothetical protein